MTLDMAEAQELETLRHAHERHYALPDGRRVAEVSPIVPLHYRDDRGWQRYAPEWVSTATGYVLQGMPFTVETIEGVAYTMNDSDRKTTFTARLTDPSRTIAPIGVGNRLFWEWDDLTIYLNVYPVGLSTHYILRQPTAPRRYIWTYDGPPPWHEVGGKDNLDERAGRHKADTHRRLDVSSERTDTTFSVTWHGRVKAIDTARRAHWSLDAWYPLRIKH